GLWLLGQIIGFMSPNLGVPVLLMLIGIIGGPLIEWSCRMAARGPARRYGQDAERRLREAAGGCGGGRVLDPVAAELLRYREGRERYGRVVGTASTRGGGGGSPPWRGRAASLAARGPAWLFLDTWAGSRSVRRAGPFAGGLTGPVPSYGWPGCPQPCSCPQRSAGSSRQRQSGSRDGRGRMCGRRAGHSRTGGARTRIRRAPPAVPG